MLHEKELAKQSKISLDLMKKAFDGGSVHWSFHQGVVAALEWAMSDKIISFEDWMEENGDKYSL